MAQEKQEAAANWAHSDFTAGAPERAGWGAFIGASLIGLVIFNPAGSQRPTAPLSSLPPPR